MARPKKENKKNLTEAELQIMNILWSKKDMSVHEVLDALIETSNKKYAYTTVSTTLRVLEKKEVVESYQEGRGHRYKAIIDKESYQKKATHHFVNSMFDGKESALIKSLLGGSNISKEELKEVKEYLEGAGL